jgi:pyruvyl transferase EpsO
MTDIVQRTRDHLLNDLRPIFAGVTEWDLVDFPHHFNCGDHAIWLGCLKVAEEFGITVRSTTSLQTYRRDKLNAAGPIVIHGGGNFGGLYPHHDELRIELLTGFRDRPIVQMPQSIQLMKPDILERLKRAIGSHPDFTFLVRDHRSLGIARKEFDCRTELVTDTAFALGNLTRVTPREELVVQARQDDEAAVQENLGHPTVDWTKANIFSLRNLGWSAAYAAGKLPAPALASAVTNRFARLNLQWAVDMLSRGRVLVTDRLHGHIIATLCGIEHIVVDDRHGKVRSFWETWTRDAPMATFVPTWRDAEGALVELRRGRYAS